MSDLDKINQWIGEHCYGAESLFIKSLVSKGFSLSQIVLIIESIDDTCNYCWDSPTGCNCWNDE